MCCFSRRDHDQDPPDANTVLTSRDQRGADDAMAKGVTGYRRGSATFNMSLALGAGGAYDDWIMIVVPLYWDQAFGAPLDLPAVKNFYALEVPQASPVQPDFLAAQAKPIRMRYYGS